MLFKLNSNLFQHLKLNSLISKSISTSLINFESNLSLLRKRTGLTFTLCKKALEANDNDLDKAEIWLKEEVKRSGLEKSQKMTFRTANEGLVGVYIDKLRKNGVILEVNCETDFVAKNEKFKELVSRLTKEYAALPQVEERPIANSIQKYVLKQDSIPKDNEQISEAITHLGEKIQIKKACFIKNHYDDQSISLVGYAHSTEGLNNYLDDVTFGKYGTIVALKQLPQDVADDSSLKSNDNESSDLNDDQIDDEPREILDFDTASKQLCQHIIVAAPETVRKQPSTDEITDENNEKQTDKPIKQTSLLDQEFLHSNSENVDAFLKFNCLEVVDFVRVKCGDE